VAIYVEELYSGGLEAFDHLGGEPLHQLIAEIVVGFRLSPQALAIEEDRRPPLDDAAVEVPAVGRKQP